jgi:hypothetical protein
MSEISKGKSQRNSKTKLKQKKRQRLGISGKKKPSFVGGGTCLPDKSGANLYL